MCPWMIRSYQRDQSTLGGTSGMRSSVRGAGGGATPYCPSHFGAPSCVAAPGHSLTLMRRVGLARMGTTWTAEERSSSFSS